MTPSILIAQPSHLESIHSLTAEWGHSASLEQTKFWLNAITDSDHHTMFVAKHEGEVRGWIVVEKRIFLDAGHKGEITALVVSQKARRMGIGKLLLAAAEQWTKELGLSHLVVRSNIARMESHAFYTMTGFEFKKTAHNYEKGLIWQ
ncbi:GNAT family N-acetyltransferase [Vibrio fluvialis]|uniref:GNAT family N-acetyltransferase n=1 Tax=Vibrio fluvialis TaxID=676 RepID=UPI0013024135|nr:GNAT family N-acetyltransferase [Vibrio fluvialis]